MARCFSWTCSAHPYLFPQFALEKQAGFVVTLLCELVALPSVSERMIDSRCAHSRDPNCGTEDEHTIQEMKKSAPRRAPPISVGPWFAFTAQVEFEAALFAIRTQICVRDCCLDHLVVIVLVSFATDLLVGLFVVIISMFLLTQPHHIPDHGDDLSWHQRSGHGVG